ncbi:MAG TPA: carboxypeptidase-like regulatory domain-containing protein, partial [Pyrinomonadaceae bacterium]|nr:carboxypeptidase-like regulatory domain-containing protein [Pyrinomonadaceae bacterium]
ASNSGATSGAANVINIVNSTVSGNTAGQNGGGIAVEQPAASGSVTLNLNFATVANNTANADNTGAEGGGGIFRSTAGSVNLKNSAVADNSVGTGGTGPDILGTVNSQDYNHIESLAGATITGTTTNNSTGPPLLGPLAYNGGSTHTHLPQAGSPLINAIPSGTNDCGTTVTTDQRGFPRPADGACEKGSVETSAGVSFAMVSGRLLTPAGRMISNAIVTLQGPGVNLTAQTGHFGTYRFVGVPTGQTYTLTVSDGKRFSFTPSSRQIVVNADVANEDFTSDNNMAIER